MPHLINLANVRRINLSGEGRVWGFSIFTSQVLVGWWCSMPGSPPVMSIGIATREGIELEQRKSNLFCIEWVQQLANMTFIWLTS